MADKSGGPAFPCVYQGDTRSDASGVTARDYFAAHALIDLSDANVSLHQNAEAKRFAKVRDDEEFPMSMLLKELVRLRWEYADAMLETRK